MTIRQKVTINEIATIVGVSKTTVSRYLNGRQDLMSDKTAERIKTVIEALDYHPSEYARGLKSNQSKIIGIVMSDIETPFTSSVICACSDYLRKFGYAPLFFHSGNDMKEEEEIIKLLIAKGCDGLIINTSSYDNKLLIEYSCRGVPIVLCDRYIKDYHLDIVTIDSDTAMRELIHHLKEQGFNRPVFFTQKWDNNSSRMARVTSFRKAMLAEYDRFHEEDIYTISLRHRTDPDLRLKEFLATVGSSEKPAIIGGNTMTTWRMFNALRKKDLRIPDQIGICGSDDWDWDDNMSWNELLYPSVTTIKFNAKELGRECARLMLERLENPSLEVREVKIPSVLSVRDSTKQSGLSKGGGMVKALAVEEWYRKSR